MRRPTARPRWRCRRQRTARRTDLVRLPAARQRRCRPASVLAAQTALVPVAMTKAAQTTSRPTPQAATVLSAPGSEAATTGSGRVDKRLAATGKPAEPASTSKLRERSSRASASTAHVLTAKRKVLKNDIAENFNFDPYQDTGFFLSRAPVGGAWLNRRRLRTRRHRAGTATHWAFFWVCGRHR